MKFKLWLEEEAKMVMIRLFQIHCSSSGSHGGWGHEEQPAGDPKLGSVDWDFELKGDYERFFTGQTVVVMENKVRGSYHERWAEIFAYIEFPEHRIWELEDAEIGFWTWDGEFDKSGYSSSFSTPMSGAKVVGQFPFHGKEDAIKKIIDMCEVIGPNGEFPDDFSSQSPVEPGMSAELWWQNHVKKSSAGKPPKGRLNWDGD